MSSPKKPSLMERRVRRVIAILDKNTDVHISEIRDALNLRVRDDHQPIMREVIDSAKFYVCYVWERPGWWTANPSEEVRRVDAIEQAKQEAARWDRLYARAKRWRPGDSLTGALSGASAAAQATRVNLIAYAPNPDRQGDFCLERIDAKVSALEESPGA